MDIISLTKDQVTSLYPHMKEAFPADELKPLSRILAGMDKGTYECKGLTDHGDMVGYAVFVRTGDHMLFDYLSVLPMYRNQGMGGIFLKMLDDYFASADSVIVEVEDPAYAENEADQHLQQRRKQFYERNGFVNTGVSTLCFGVHYLLLMHHAHILDAETVKQLYLDHYQAMLPKLMFRRFIQV